MRTILSLALAAALLPSAGVPTADMAVPPAQQRCHPSYPDFCIAPPPPDLDCPQIPANRRPFRVLHNVRSPDPHGFDRDRDGRGCERSRGRRN